MQNFPNL